MASKRMFTMKIVDSDEFLEMPPSSQNLYFHLNMRADDDGFINNPKRIMRDVRATEDDLRVLLAKRFLLQFDHGVIVIKHWRMHNTIRKDRYTPTQYQEELSMLGLKENSAYTFNGSDLDTERIQNGNQLATNRQPSGTTDIGLDKGLDKGLDTDSVLDIDSSSVREKKHKYGEYHHVLLTDSEHEKLVNRFGEYDTELLIAYLDASIEEHGYKYKSHYLTISKENSWVQREVFKLRNDGGGIDWSKI